MRTVFTILGVVSLFGGGYLLGHYHGAHPRRRLLLPPLKRRRG